MLVRLFLPKTEYGHTGTGLARGFSREYRETGCESPTQKRHCKVYVLSDWRRCAGHSRERGRLCGKNGLLPHTPSQDIRFRFFHRLSRRSVCECIKTFAPKLLWLWCFLFVRTAGVYTPILYGVKNDMFCSRNGNNSPGAACKYRKRKIRRKFQ